MHYLCSLIALTALLSGAFAQTRQYYFVSTSETWTDAQSFCRQEYTDLATLENTADVDAVVQTTSSYTGKAWTGLYDGWIWALNDPDFYGDGETMFRNWNSGEPNNYNGQENCVNMFSDGKWNDLNCMNRLPFVCYNGMSGGSAVFVFRSQSATWTEAQAFCRNNYVDLVSIRNQGENDVIRALAGTTVWIGLTRKELWSDGSNSQFVNWAAGQPTVGSDKCVAAAFDDSGKWSKEVCTQSLPFICYENCVDGDSFYSSADVCSVTGPVVIDFQGALNSVSDLCAYALVSDPSNGFTVLANFGERRQPDVSFVDSVTLRLAASGVQIHLEQGGRVRVNDDMVTLNSSVQQFHGVDLSKDETGVTAQFTACTLIISVFFDGTTVQIHKKSPSGSSLSGLCVDSNSVSSARLLQYSSARCEPQDSSVDISAIPHNNVTERCNLMRAAPFTSCNGDIDPTPYITGCKNSCRYSSKDHLWCQFMWAYARACSLKHGNAIGPWWKTAKCSPPRALCQDKFCSDHEYCGRKFSGEYGCLCRAWFASKFNTSYTLGEQTECKHNSASITLAGCLMEEKGIDYTVLHLNDKSCRGVINEETHMVTFSFSTRDSCDAEIMTIGNQIKYTNAIMNQNSTDVITRHDQVFIEFSCYYPEPELKTVYFRIKDNSYVSTITSGEWTYNVTMNAYIDEQCTKVVVMDTEVKLNQKVWIELKTSGLDADTVAVVTDSCWATSEKSPDSTPKHDLIVDGCAAPGDGTVRVKGNGIGTSNYFSFNMFEFTNHPNDVYLHCQLQLCLKKDNCVPVCPDKRRRRFARSQRDTSALISMGWGK
ncbi:alpha-tectorin-like [Kryptolebias marmoratus]|uniref:Alpha-tectorin-like n=1 Tax=Kryptolebias marmoratus TaxID=37003 RepID=A0A3Q2ZS86_KRYMA|nr:alpha-tectorin-like [Kryptolebias marmoratus]